MCGNVKFDIAGNFVATSRPLGRLAENQPTAGLSSLIEYDNDNEYENVMRKSETELTLGTFTITKNM